MTPQDAFNLGVSLKDALDKYGNWRKFDLEDYLPPDFPIESVENNPQAISKALSTLNDAFWAPGKRRNDVAEDFRRRLSSGKLLGVGYLSPRSISDLPVEIPADVWSLAKINYGKSEIQSGSLKFENVRITKSLRNSKFPAPPKLYLVSSKASELPRSKGRPSSRANIFAAYRQLKGAGEIDFSAPMTHAYPKIRTFLIEQHGTEKGFQNEAIRLAIKDDFKATAQSLKAAQKL